MNHSSSFYYWNLLPNEIKMIITKQLEKKSRLNLRACSKNDKELVDSVRVRELYAIELSMKNSRSFIITLVQTEHYTSIKWEFDSFDNFQKNVIDRIEEYDFIGTLTINYHYHDPLLTVKFSSTHGQLVKVGKLVIGQLNVESYLEQVDPFYLKHLSLSHFDVPCKVYDIPLVINVNKLDVYVSCIRNDQLLKLENQTLTLRKCEHLTLEGINQYIQKCVLNLDNKQVKFEFALVNPIANYDTLFEGLDIFSSCMSRYTGEAIINSKSGNFQLNIDYKDNIIEGRTSIFQNSEKRTGLKENFAIVDKVIFESSDLRAQHKLSITKNNCENKYCFDSSEGLQKKLFEEIEGVDYIRGLRITCRKDCHSNWVFRRTPNQQITVGKLTIDGGENYAEILKQIVPVDLKEITLYGSTDIEEIYSLQQIIKAETLFIYTIDCRINDAQLLQLNAAFLCLSTEEHRYTTHFGINAFLKKCVLNLDKYEYNILLYKFINKEDTFDIFEGLERLEKSPDSYRGRVMLTSPFSEYLLEVEIDWHQSLKVRRIMKEFIDNYTPW